MLKFLPLLIGIILMAASCSKGCDTETAAGAAECYCHLIVDIQQAQQKKDQKKISELEEITGKVMNDISESIEQDKFSWDDFYAEISKEKCLGY